MNRHTLRQTAESLEDYGRNGDTELAHLTPGEIIIPKSAQTPEVRALLAALLGQSGHDIGRFTVGGGDDSRNPTTKLREFWDPSDPGDSGPPSDPNAGQVGNDFLPGEPTIGGVPTNPQTAHPGTFADFSSTPGESFADATKNGYQPRGFFERAFDWAGRGIANKAYDVVNNPFAAVGNLAFNAATGGIPAAANTISGWVDGPTFGSAMAAGGRAVGNALGFNGPQIAPEAQVAGQLDGKAPGSIGPSGDPDKSGEGGEGYNPTQSGPSGSGKSPLAQALLGETVASDPWKNMGGRRSFGPLVSSYSPTGREYVTPWGAYR